jgi:hypothetical protein
VARWYQWTASSRRWARSGGWAILISASGSPASTARWKKPLASSTRPAARSRSAADSRARRSPRLAGLLREHWAIENGLHYVRDVTFAEDASQVRSGTGPQVMACLRTLVIGTLSSAAEPVYLAAALRHHARDPARPLATLGITPDETDITQERRSLGPASQRHGPGRKARGHAERRRSGPVPSRPSPSALTTGGRSVGPALDPDRANVMRVGMCRSNQFWGGSSSYG